MIDNNFVHCSKISCNIPELKINIVVKYVVRIVCCIEIFWVILHLTMFLRDDSSLEPDAFLRFFHTNSHMIYILIDCFYDVY